MFARDWWGVRIIGSLIFAIAYVYIVWVLHVAEFGGLGQSNEILREYRESLMGQMNRLILEVLKWPIVKPVEMAGVDIWWGGPLYWLLYVNGFVWCLSVCLLLELLVRAVARVFHR